jgi:predicted metal-dependent hydrolase
VMLHASEARALIVGDEKVDYTLHRTGRRRTVGIFVEPDRRLTVLAPVAADTESVERILRRRLPWIRRQMRKVEALPPPPPPRHWVNGETHRYLGRQYRLKLVEGGTRTVTLSGDYVCVTVPNPNDRASIGRLMYGWYRDRARCVVIERAERLIATTTWLGVSELPPIAIKSLSHRWGSTTKAGRIAFNVDVVKLTPACLDYVIAHELVHLRIPNHSPAFWRMLTRVMPDWRRWRDLLAQAEL